MDTMDEGRLSGEEELTAVFKEMGIEEWGARDAAVVMIRLATDQIDGKKDTISVRTGSLVGNPVLADIYIPMVLGVLENCPEKRGRLLEALNSLPCVNGDAVSMVKRVIEKSMGLTSMNYSSQAADFPMAFENGRFGSPLAAVEADELSGRTQLDDAFYGLQYRLQQLLDQF